MTKKELIDKIKQYPLGEGGLKVHTEIDNQLQIISMIDCEDNEIILWSNDNFCNESGDRIVLRPLSLLTEENRPFKYSNIEDFKNSIYNKIITAQEIKTLLSNYFDVFGLINKGYAISTLDKSLKGIKGY